MFIISELFANHGGDIEIAKRTIRAANRTGADAIKLQTYIVDTMTLDSDKEDSIIRLVSIWDGKTYFDLYKEAYTHWKWHEELYKTAK